MSPWQSDPLLKVEHLTMRFGGLTAVDDASFEVGRRDITALIGPNGAGKTTVFNCITGFYKPTEGMMKLDHPDGQSFNLERLDDHDINARARIARTFQNIRLFSGMTVLENLMVAQHNVLMRASGLTIGAILGLSGFGKAERQAVDHARHWLERVGVTRRALAFHVGKAVVAPEVHDLIERTDITHIVAHQLKTVPLRHRQRMLLEKLQVLCLFARDQRVGSDIDNHLGGSFRVETKSGYRS